MDDGLHTARIAFVGGDEIDRQTLDAILRDDGGPGVRLLTPPDALEALRLKEIDLLLVELMQTSSDVLALMRAAQTAGMRGGSIPVVVVAPPGAADRVQACLQRGASDYLTTPFDRVNSLLVRRRIERRARPRSADDARAVHRFIPREFLGMLDRPSLADVRLGDHVLRDITVFFADIRDFTQLSERLTPAENFKFLTSYLSNVTPIIRECGGFVDKYLGDGVMALFPGEAQDAVRAGVELLRQLARYNYGRHLAGYEPITIGIGVHRGSVLMGTIGADDQMQTTVIADVVNLASRIEGMTKTFGVQMLVSGSIVENLPPSHAFRLRPLGAVLAKGKTQSVEIFECYDNDPGDLMAHKDQTLEQFAIGMAEFRKGKILTAGRIFARIAEIESADTVAAYFRDRCTLSVVRKRGRDRWDGAEHIEIK